jgi:propanol-preferring alcohol dehydrogenase
MPTIRAMVLDRPKTPLVLRERPVPQPAAGQVLIAVEACGVCRTDLHVVDGELPDPKLPVVPGHEIVGRVAALGPDVRNFRAWHARRRAVAWRGLRGLSVLPVGP